MGCTVLTHEQNRGKGAALKTALRWYGAHEDGCAGIVTADCDGQHTVKDVRRVCEAMEACPGTLVLGCRDFGPGHARAQRNRQPRYLGGHARAVQH